jgi:hypothetical protein
VQGTRCFLYSSSSSSSSTETFQLEASAVEQGKLPGIGVLPEASLLAPTTRAKQLSVKKVRSVFVFTTNHLASPAPPIWPLRARELTRGCPSAHDLPLKFLAITEESPCYEHYPVGKRGTGWARVVQAHLITVEDPVFNLEGEPWPCWRLSPATHPTWEPHHK